MTTILLATLLGLTAHSDTGRVSASLGLTCTITSSADLTLNTRETGLDGVALVDVTTGGQGQVERTQTVLYIAGSTHATVVWSEAGPLWALPADALAYELRPGDEPRALAYVQRARGSRARLAALLRSVRPAQVLLAEAP